MVPLFCCCPLKFPRVPPKTGARESENPEPPSSSEVDHGVFALKKEENVKDPGQRLYAAAWEADILTKSLNSKT